MPYQYKGRKKWFTKNEVISILKSDERQIDIARRLKVHRDTIRKIQRGLTFKKIFNEYYGIR